MPMVTLLDDNYRYVRAIEPGRAHKRVERGDAEWVTADGSAPDLRYGTIRMVTPRGADGSARRDVLLVLSPEGVILMQAATRDASKLRRRLKEGDPEAQDRGWSIILSRPLDAASRDEIIVALSAAAADGAARFARLREVVQDVMRRAGAERSSDLAQQDLSHIARLLARELRQDMSITEVVVELQRMGRLLGPDRMHVRELAAELQHLTLRPRQRQNADATPSLFLADGNHRAGHGGGRQSVTMAEAHCAAARQ